ncbi:MAG: response regulator transcription factor [Lachnospiraceae bacterium]|nr:response regulator transcription factor [Ruminococcus sp.]MCM1273968.1 response regulator transcription factor [Lachnospiraceae bacterium]
MSEIIAVIDDDPHINNMLCELLSREGYEVMRAFSGGEALALLEEKTPDLVLLDLMMPGLSGERVLPRIGDVPVIVMSARADVGSKVELLLSGAVDYVTKPFDTKELLARIRVQLRRNTRAELLEYGGLSLNTELHEAKFGGNAVKLTKTEFAILKILMQNPKQVITKSQILDRISADTPDCVESSLKVHVSNLRKKLRDASGLDFIEAVWGIGFKMREILT